MKKIKIAYLVSTLNKSGPINILYGIIKNLDLKKFEITIITLSSSDNSSMAEVFIKFNCNIVSLDLKRIKDIFKYKKEITKILVEKEIKILHSHCFRADYYSSSLKIKGLKKISTIHNYPFEDYVLHYGNILGKIMSYSSINFLKKIDYRIVCSKSLKERWEKFLKVHSIENGVDISRYMPVTYDEKNGLRRKFKIPAENKIFIVSGVLTKRKNPLLIIEAFQKIKLKNSILIFLGEGELYQECSNKVSDEDKIIFMGNVKDVSEYLKMSDYYISASFSEGLPNSVLEAMATGLPCLLSNISSHKEIGIGEKYLFNPRCSEELEEKIKTLLTEDYKKLSILNRKIVEKKFSDKLMSERYSNYYISE